MEFTFDNERPIYIQLVEQFKIYIISGKISPGERLPSIRDMAINLKINPNTLQRGLMELENEGFIYTERTNGKYVTNDIKLINTYKKDYAKEKVIKYFDDMKELGFNKEEALSYIKEIGEKNGVIRM